MTNAEKRDYILQYCKGRDCNETNCVVSRVANADYDAGITDEVICFGTDSDELLDRRVAAIQGADKSKPAPATPDDVNRPTTPGDAIHPHHYKLPGGMQVIDVEVAMFGREAVMHHCLCTAAEYILRSRQKNGVEDIKKAHWWLCKYIELEEKNK